MDIGKTSHVGHGNKANKTLFVYVNSHIAGKHVRPAVMYAHISQLVVWAMLCREVDVSFLRTLWPRQRRLHRRQGTLMPENHIMDFGTWSRPRQNCFKDKAMIVLSIGVIDEIFSCVFTMATPDFRSLPDSEGDDRIGDPRFAIPFLTRQEGNSNSEGNDSESNSKGQHSESNTKGQSWQKTSLTIQEFPAKGHFGDCGADLTGLHRDV